MSFLKIVDPAKREQTVKEFLAIKKNIRANELAEKTGKIELQEDLSEFFKLVTKTQKATQKEIQRAITSGLEPIKKGLEDLPQAITFKAFPSIKAYGSSEGSSTENMRRLMEEIEEMGEMEDKQPLLIGPLAQQQLRRFTNKDEADTTYGLYDKNGIFFIGNKPVEILEDNILIEDKNYGDSPGLWELIVAKKPDKSKYNKKDLDNYKEIMVKTNTLRRNNDPKSKLPKSGKSYKWKNLLSHIWYDSETYGSGIVIPSDPNALLEKLDLLIASKAAGNTGVRNEVVSMSDELKRQGVFDSNIYKKIMSLL